MCLHGGRKLDSEQGSRSISKLSFCVWKLNNFLKSRSEHFREQILGSRWLHTCLAYIHTLHTHIHTLHTLHYITLHYITLHYITLHYITLHTLHTYIWYGASEGGVQNPSPCDGFHSLKCSDLDFKKNGEFLNAEAQFWNASGALFRIDFSGRGVLDLSPHV